jgi:hypothetical protein
MAWATRSDRDRQALNDYVTSYSSVLDAWRNVPGLTVSLDKTRVEAALEKRERQITGKAKDD